MAPAAALFSLETKEYDEFPGLFSTGQIQHRDNCSNIFVPATEDYLPTLSTVNIIFLVLASITCCTTCFIFVEEVIFMNRNLLQWKPRSHAMWLLGLYPVFSITSIIGLLIPRTYALDDMVATLYLSVSVYYFCRMLIEHYGGKDKMSIRLENETVSMASPPLCCCCTCLPTIKITKDAVHILEFMVLQFAFVRPLVAYAVSIVALNSGPVYLGGSLEASSTVYTVSGWMISISTMTAIYGNTLLYKASVNHLEMVKIKPKFLCMQSVLILDNIQRSIFASLVSFKVIECTPPLDAQKEAQRLHHLLLIFEMFALSCVARFFYRRTMERMSPEDSHVVERITCSTMTSPSDFSSSSDDSSILAIDEEEENTSRPLTEFHNATYDAIEGLQTTAIIAGNGEVNSITDILLDQKMDS